MSRRNHRFLPDVKEYKKCLKAASAQFQFYMLTFIQCMEDIINDHCTYFG